MVTITNTANSTGNTTSGVSALLGIASNTTGGSFSSGVRGRNLATTFAGAGVVGSTNGSGSGVIGAAANGRGLEGDGTIGLISFGDAQTLGTLSKSGGSFKIDHPLDPAHKTLSHSFVESPDMMNIYNGNVRIDAKGRAWIELPDWFETLNRDFRYQLTPIGGPGPVWIGEEVEENMFLIEGPPGLKVSWQVTGIRQDPWALMFPIPLEQDKEPAEVGYYLSPEAYGLPPEYQSPQRSSLQQRPAPVDVYGE